MYPQAPLTQRPLATEVFNALNGAIDLLGQRIKGAMHKRNTFGDRIIISDEVLVYEGAKLKFKSKGHIVNNGLIAIANLLSVTSIGTPNYVPSTSWATISYGFIRCGADTTTVTSASTTNLTAPITTASNAQSGVTANPSGGVYRISWIVTWNAGIISGTVGELGLWWYGDNTFRGFNSGSLSPAVTLASRLSVADGDFTAFAINTTVPLTIEWRLTFTFA